MIALGSFALCTQCGNQGSRGRGMGAKRVQTAQELKFRLGPAQTGIQSFPRTDHLTSLTVSLFFLPVKWVPSGVRGGVVGHPTGCLPRRAWENADVVWLAPGLRQVASTHCISSGRLEEVQSQHSPGQRLTSGDLGLTSGDSSWLATTVC